MGKTNSYQSADDPTGELLYVRIAMKHWSILVFSILLALSVALWLLPNPWTFADARAARDSASLSDLARRPDRLRMRLAADPALKNAVVWNAEGVVLHPEPEKFNHVLFELSQKELRKLNGFLTKASPRLWTLLDSSGETLVHCSHPTATCLLYDRRAFQDALGLTWQSLSTPDRRPLWLALSISAATLFGALVLFNHRKIEAVRHGFTLLPERHAVIWNGTEVSLTPRDVKLLALLKAREGAVVTKDELYDAGWGRQYMPNSRALDQHIINLRRKLDPEKSGPDLIETVHGVGYRLSS